ncbi:MAG: hypothetical protein WBF33_10350 [Candidatus Nitrosopolaris sp.]
MNKKEKCPHGKYRGNCVEYKQKPCGEEWRRIKFEYDHIYLEDDRDIAIVLKSLEERILKLEKREVEAEKRAHTFVFWPEIPKGWGRVLSKEEMKAESAGGE